MNALQKGLFDQLTELQQRLCTNVIAGMTQRQAYVAAGGKAATETAIDSSASEILRNPQVMAFMGSMKDQAISDAVMSRQEALERLSNFARTDLKDLVEFGNYEIGVDDETGKPIVQASWSIKDSALQDPQKMAVISELTAGKEGIKIKTHSPITAIQQLAKMQGWESASKHEVSGPNGAPIESRTVVALDEGTLNSLIEKL